MWRDKLGLGEEIKPIWRVLYKPPLNKRSVICNGEYYMVLSL